MRVLALEPYFGGSHQAFLDGWQRHSRHQWTTLTLPAHKWKWRMRQSSLLFAWEIEGRFEAGERWDLVFCSDMLNLAELRGLARKELSGLPAVLYFHENQLTYPVRIEKERDMHFGVSNISSAVAASEVWFNSAFHRNSFLDAIPGFLSKMPDHAPLAAIERIRAKSIVRYPGIEAAGIAARSRRSKGRPDAAPLHLLWAARWEHDKNPEDFFCALDLLEERGAEFRISVLGQSFREVPPIFEEARERFEDRIVNWGFLESRREYDAALAETDVFVSTADHEFFGLAAIEAIAAGAYPILPRRLSYPELLGLDESPAMARFFYSGSAPDLAARLAELCERKSAADWRPTEAPLAVVERFFWPKVAAELDQALERVRSGDCLTKPSSPPSRTPT